MAQFPMSSVQRFNFSRSDFTSRVQSHIESLVEDYLPPSSFQSHLADLGTAEEAEEEDNVCRTLEASESQ